MSQLQVDYKYLVLLAAKLTEDKNKCNLPPSITSVVVSKYLIYLS